MSVRRKNSLAFLMGLALAAPAPAQFGPVAQPQGGMQLFQNALGGQGGGGMAMPQGGIGIGRLLNTPVVPGGFGNPGYSPLSQLPAPSPYPYYSPYSSYYDPFGGYYRGVGDLVNSYGKYIN